MSDLDDELTEEQKEVKDAVKRNPGCTVKSLERTLPHLSNRDIALNLHRLSQQMVIYKKGDGYFDSDISEAQMAELEQRTAAARIEKLSSQPAPVAKPAQSAPVASKEHEPAAAKPAPVVAKPPEQPAAAPAAKAEPEKVYGAYRRGSDTGVIAMFFYEERNNEQGFSAEDVAERLKAVLKKPPKTTMYIMGTAGVIVGDERTRGKRYKWSGKLVYPFSKMLPTDCQLVPREVKVEAGKPAVEAPAASVPAVKAETQLPAIVTHPLVISNAQTFHGIGPAFPDGTLNTLVGSNAGSVDKTVLAAMINMRIDSLRSEVANLEALKKVVCG